MTLNGDHITLGITANQWIAESFCVYLFSYQICGLTCDRENKMLEIQYLRKRSQPDELTKDIDATLK